MKTVIRRRHADERSEALRATFPAMPRGGDVLCNVLRNAAIAEDEARISARSFERKARVAFQRNGEREASTGRGQSHPRAHGR